MKVKSAIAAVAITAASLSYGLTPPPVQVKTLCLRTYADANGAQRAGRCDESNNNQILGLPLLSNGCAERQVALTTVKYSHSSDFDIKIYSCLPPNVVQL